MEITEDILYEVIKSGENISEAYKLLGDLYASKGCVSKATVFYGRASSLATSENEMTDVEIFFEEDSHLSRIYHTTKNIKHKTFIFLSSVSWGQVLQRPHHLASSLSLMGHEVFYVSSCLCIETVENFNTEQSLDVICKNFQIIENVTVYNLFTVTKDKETIFNPTSHVLEYICKQSSHEIIFVPNSPTFYSELKLFGRKYKIIYDCLDDQGDYEYTGWGNEHNIILENKLIKISHAVMTTSTSLFLNKAVNENCRNLYLSRNATNYEDFQFKTEINCPDDLKNIPEPRIMYMGALIQRFDTELFQKVVEQNPDKSFVVLGFGNPNLLTSQLHNLYFLGEAPHRELKNYLAFSQVGIIPFRDYANVILHCDSIKHYEYLTMQLPVVSTFIPDSTIGKINSYSANTPEAFTKMLNTALASEPFDYDTLMDFLISNSWHSRAALLARIACDNCYEDEKSDYTLNELKCILKELWDIHPNFEVLYALAVKQEDYPTYEKHVRGAYEKSQSRFICSEYKKLADL